MPTSSDDVYFDTSSNAADYTVTLGTGSLTCNNLTISNPAIGTFTWAGTNRTITISGGVNVREIINVVSKAQATFNSTSANTLSSSNSNLFSVVTFNGVGGSWTLTDDVAFSGTVTLTNGSFNTNGYNLSVPIFASSNSNVRSLSFGSSFVTFTSGNATVALNLSATNLTFNAGTSTLKFTNTTNGTFQINGAGQTFYNLWFDRGTSTGTITVTGSNTYNDLIDTGTETHTLQFASGTTQTFRNFHVSGTPGHLITLRASSNTFNQVKIDGGFVSVDYLAISRSIATPTETWYAGAHSTNNQSIGPGSGWFFTLPFGYINISKPTNTDYTYVNEAKPVYDQYTLTYDDPLMFYDGFDQFSYTNVPKPVDSYPVWDLMSIEWREAQHSWDSTSGYTKVPKP